MSQIAVAANRCQPYKDKFTHIQRLQKQGHSVKQSITLHERERKAWQKWMDCKKGKLKKKSKSKKKAASTLILPAYQSPKKLIALDPGSVFDNKKGVTVKGKYSGKKQQAWLDFYQPLEKCRKPKSTQAFALCLQDRDQQQVLFEAQYQP
ncbi:MAG: hypothetical protein ACSHW0_03650 [Thalassotalea sp.]